MPRVVINLKPKHNGGYSHRKRIPVDVRDEYARQFGKRSEEWFTTSTDVSLPAAKTRYLEWAAEIQSRFASIRAARKGGGRALTKKQALGLAGEWYVWFVKRHEDAPGTPEHWQARWLALLDDLEEPAPPAVQASTDGGAIWEWLNSAEARPIVRPIIADEAQTAQFLASQGLVLSNEARDMFLDMVATSTATTTTQKRNGKPIPSRRSTKPCRAIKPSKIRDVKFPPASTSNRIDPRAMSGAEIEQKENPGLPGLK